MLFTCGWEKGTDYPDNFERRAILASAQGIKGLEPITQWFTLKIDLLLISVQTWTSLLVLGFWLLFWLLISAVHLNDSNWIPGLLFCSLDGSYFGSNAVLELPSSRVRSQSSFALNSTHILFSFFSFFFFCLLHIIWSFSPQFFV